MLRQRGWELRRIPTEPEVPKADQWLRDLGVATVLDVGANVGQFATEIRNVLPAARIISFEPLRDCYEQLVGVGHRLGNAEAHRVALAAEEGYLEMHRSEFSQSSSLRPMAPLHKEAFPFTARERIEIVPVARLDDLDLSLVEPILIKVDVQGYEDRVISGGRQTIARAAAVLVETSFHRLYEGAPLFADTVALLGEMGFSYAGARGQLTDPRNGQPLQENSIFVPSGRTSTSIEHLP